MNLYYEDVPASGDEDPQLPPLLTAEKVAAGTDAMAKAIARAAAGESGLVCFSAATHVLDMAITLAPEVDRARAMQMQATLMVALGDSIGALAPPEVGVRYRFPGAVLLNGGHAGVVRIAAAPGTDSGEPPGWVVVSAQLRLHFTDDGGSAEYRMANTSLGEEGGGFVSRTRLVESLSRHFLVWLHRWEDEGFRPVHEAWMQRADEDRDLRLGDGTSAVFTGLDEDGAGLVTVGGVARTVPVAEQEAVFGAGPLAELADGEGP